MSLSDAPPLTQNRMLWIRGNTLCVITGMASFAVAMLIWGGSAGYLNLVIPLDRDFGPRDYETPPAWGISLHLLLLCAAAIASAGLPTSRTDGWIRLGAFTQAFSGIAGVVAAGAGLTFANAILTVGPGDACRYSSCWPKDEQNLALALPVVALGVLMLVMGALATRLSWRVRALVPVGIFLVLLGVQAVLWHAWLFPMFQRGPA